MKKGFLKCIAVMMVVIMTAVYMPMTDVSDLFSVEAAAATKTGSLGNNVSWKYDTSTKTITVSGSGNMKNFANGDDGQDWDSLVIWSTQYPNKHAEKIVINNGVTNIGNNAFRGLTAVKSVTIPASVTSIGTSAFEGCSSLSSVTLPEKLKSIGANAFKNTKFASVTLPDTITSISSNSFSGVSGLKIVCNYNTDTYNCLINNGIQFSFPSNKFIVDAKLDVANKQVLVNIKMIYNKANFNAGNFTLTYDSTVSPVSTEPIYKSENGVALATVYNTGKVSFAMMAETYVPYSTNSGVCVYDFGTIAFKVNNQNDTTAFEFKSDVIMMNESKTSINKASASVALHSYSDVVTKEANCNAIGEKKTECSICGIFTLSDIPVNPNNHVGDTQITGAKEATCAAPGHTGVTECKACKTVISAGSEIPATGAHNYNSVVTAPTCTEKGFTTYTCTVCGDSYKGDETATIAHDNVAVVTAPTCTEKGFTTYTCTVCGNSYKGDETDTIAHNNVAVVTAPTCTEKGFTTYTCTVCGKSYKDNETDFTGHTAGEWETVKNAEIGVAGLEVKNCTSCGEKLEEREISALEDPIKTELEAKTDSNVTVDNESKITIITAETNITDLKNLYTNENLRILDQDGVEIPADEFAGTSCKIQVLSSDNTVISEYVVVVPMDVNGDASITASDARLVLRAAAELDVLEGEKLIAGDADNSTEITASDARNILRTSAGL